MLEEAENIDMMYDGNIDSITIDLLKLQRNKQYHAFIFSSYTNEIFDIFPLDIPENILEKYPSLKGNNYYVQKYTAEMTEELYNRLVSEKVLYDTAKYDFLDTDMLVMYYLLRNSDILVIEAPLLSINRNSDAATRFITFSGILLFIFGIQISFIYSRIFTRPIKKLKSIAEKMAKLDFSEKYTERREDEIGELGNSINILSEELDGTINQLKKEVTKEKQLKEKEKEFLSNISHELKTPLALIQGYAEGLQDSVNDDEESREYYASVIVDEAKRMDKLVRELLMISRMESEREEINPVKFSITTMIENIIKKHNLELKEKDVTVHFVEGEEFVKADKFKISEVVENFYTNAIKHCDYEKLIIIRYEKIGDILRIKIQNSGKTIPEDQLNKIWDKFYKVDFARKRNTGGTGIGLYVVSKIQELHSQKYGVINTSEGVEFWFDVKL
jgi:signal transduction histidine kinase